MRSLERRGAPDPGRVVPDPGRAVRGSDRGVRSPDPDAEEPKGCLFALSQPPLMFFLCFIAGLIGFGALYDIVML
ncbi:hypothetical protein ABZ721_34825 [Streptomyces sp. NPDC006733]|uniref:hypothetical protein n=1 Tax=Streptomyces sp. NPDC006733 TaxID=3155460 RepID=UPI0033C259B1